ncbi:GGDEF domain-containing protein [Fulvimarina sp. MAC3]|uniref:GGDEF domain-containing protein n=1 Tax=Fulvimarina sp. MAC3 TaxID=3148887 RepID=UPI0031FC802E
MIAGIVSLCISIAAGLVWHAMFHAQREKRPRDLLILGLLVSLHAAPILMTEAAPLSQIGAILGLVSSSVIFALFLGSLMLREDRMMRREAELSRAALRDPLTKVANRRGFGLTLRAIKERREQRPLAVLVVDIDHFKRVNDRFGHTAGDQILQVIAAKLRLTAGREATVARFGGEEFVVLLDDTLPCDARSIAEDARKSISDWTSVDEKTTIDVTVSIGVAGALNAEDTDRLIREADDALYQAKADGRNCVRVHQASSAPLPIYGPIAKDCRRFKASNTASKRYPLAS